MLKSVFRRLRKGIKDVGSFAGGEGKGIMSIALPLLLGAGALPGGKKFGLETLFGNLGNLGNIGRSLIGGFDKVIKSPTAETLIEGSGILGTGQDILGSLTGKEKLGGIMGLINTYLAKKQFDQEKADELRREQELIRKANLVSDKFGSELGGTPFVEEMIKGTVYDPKTEKYYDYYDRDTDTYGLFKADEEGKIIPRASGGIAQLNVGGHPDNTMHFKIPARRATGGIMDEMVSEEIFDPRMSGNQMMNEIKKNPGITEFFPPKFGMIEGPGGPKDDKIPAMLSDGEFVMTAKAVDNAGGPKAMYGLMNALDPESSKGKGIV